MKTNWIVRAADGDFVEKETFDSYEKAIEYADKMCEIFGSRNVEIYKA